MGADMSRKNVFGHLKPASEPSSTPAPAAPPLAHLGRMLATVRDRAQRAEEIEKALISADRIIDVEPKLIDPSPVRDRLPSDAADDESLRESIAQSGQRVPVLLRPSATDPTRFQTIFGHRRIAQCTALGRSVRAVIVEMSDDDALVAQGVENNERRDLSFVERSLFALELTNRGLTGHAIATSIGTSRPNVVEMIAIARAIPRPLIVAIGRAQGVGQPRWRRVADALKTVSENDVHAKAKWAAVIQDAAFVRANSETRIAMVLTALSDAVRTRGADGFATLKDGEGVAYASVKSKKAGDADIRIADDADVSFRPDGRKFSDWMIERLPSLRDDWRQGR